MISTISKQVQSDWKGIKMTECENSNEKLSLIYDEMITKLNITDGKKKPNFVLHWFTCYRHEANRLKMLRV